MAYYSQATELPHNLLTWFLFSNHIINKLNPNNEADNFLKQYTTNVNWEFKAPYHIDYILLGPSKNSIVATTKLIPQLVDKNLH